MPGAALDVSAGALLVYAARWRPPVTLLRVRGATAFDYLQRTVSADLRALRPEQGLLATVMTGKGRLVAPLDIYSMAADETNASVAPSERPSSFLLITDAAAAAGLESHLRRTIILDDVDVEVLSPAHVLLTVQGPSASAVLAKWLEVDDLRASERSSRRFGAGWLMRRRRSVQAGWDLVLPAGDAHDVEAVLTERAGVVEATAEAAEAARIEAGEPRFGVDVTSDNLPPECGYEGGLSYSKGCYAGQEVVARVRTYGHVNKLLRRVRLDTAVLPEAGSELTADGRGVGRLTSVTRTLDGQGAMGLGFLRLTGAEAGTQVRTVTGAGDDVVGTVEELRPSVLK